MSKNSSSTQLNCFSPPVMLATLVIEFSLAIYTLWRYKMQPITRLIAATLICLATFQLAEYFVCTGPVNQAPTWSRLGFVAISILPPLGVHILHVIANKSQRLFVWLGYGVMTIFILLFIFSKNALFGYQCNGNYVIFQVADNWGSWYTTYYYGWLAISVLTGTIWANQLRKQGKKALQRLEAVQGLIIGWLVFIVPTLAVAQLKPETQRAIPSVMCGFAVLFALILGLYILPRVAMVKNRSK